MSSVSGVSAEVLSPLSGDEAAGEKEAASSALHQPCYQFFRVHHDADSVTWVVPGLLIFEFQAIQSRQYREFHPERRVCKDEITLINPAELTEESPAL